MPKMVKVRFKNEEKIFEFESGELELKTNQEVAVETEKGIRVGTVLEEPREKISFLCPKAIKKIIRLANREDLEREEKILQKEKEGYQAAQRGISRLNLSMKLVKVEYFPEINKLVVYFTAAERVDFRELVRELARELRARIEMRQIGTRNEAKMIGGINICGRELCCATFLTNFLPVSIRMAKDQGLSLDPNKISGVCGRLMCCLVYEHEIYRELKKNLPRCGKKVITPQGAGRVLRQNIIKQEIVVELEDGRETVVKTTDIQKEGLFKKYKKVFR